jgi:hypothetical protein
MEPFASGEEKDLEDKSEASVILPRTRLFSIMRSNARRRTTQVELGSTDEQVESLPDQLA